MVYGVNMKLLVLLLSFSTSLFAADEISPIYIVDDHCRSCDTEVVWVKTVYIEIIQSFTDTEVEQNYDISEITIQEF